MILKLTDDSHIQWIEQAIGEQLELGEDIIECHIKEVKECK